MAITPFNLYLEQKKEQDILSEAFNSPSYEITFGKKGAGDIFFTFVDEDNKEFRIQFYTPAGLGKSVRQVFIGQKKGSVYPDAQQRFKNPMKVIATMIEATKQFLQTPIGKGIDGFAINFSKKALERGLALIPRIIKQSDLKQKLNVLDLTFSPDPARGYVWVIRKGKKPEDVFNGPKMEGVTWSNESGDVPAEVASRDSGESPFVTRVKTHEKIADELFIEIRKLDHNIVRADTGTSMTSGENEFRLTLSTGYVRIDFPMDSTSRKINIHYAVVLKGKYHNILPDNEMDGVYQDIKSAAKDIVARTKKYVSQYLTPNAAPIIGVSLKDLTIPKGGDLGTDARNPSSGKVFWNGFKFPKTPDGAEDITFATKIEMSKDSAKITENVYRGGGVINSPKTFELGRPGLNNVAVVNRYLEERAKKIDHYKWVISTLADTNYNPSGLAMTDVEFTHDGRMLLGGNNVSSMTGSQVISYIDGMKRSETAKSTMAQQAALSNLKKEIGSYNADTVMGVAKILGITAASADKAMDAMIQNSNLQDIRVAKKKYDATAGAIKFKNAGNTSIEELKTSVTLMAKGGGSDVDWQVYTREDSVIAEWNITYRRDTCVGAFHNYRASVNSANKVLQAIKTKYEVLGFNVDLRLMTEEQAREWDNIAEMNEGSAYSEYEASIGGSVKITK